MAYGSIPLDKRLKDNIKNYKLSSLIGIEVLEEQIKAICKMTGLQVMVTDRHGEKYISYGDFAMDEIDVVNKPGIKVRVCSRTIAHVYVKYDKVPEDIRSTAEKYVDAQVKMCTDLAHNAYTTRELEIYADELESKLEKESYQAKNGEKNDELTGTLNRTYFENRMNIVDRSQVVPVAGVCININDWKYVNDNYGDDESDRLISTIAGIILDESKPDYIVGRVDGDVFNVLIPMPQDDECDEFCARIRNACDSYEDPILAPSVAIGYAYKENVESKVMEALSDAEYNMFENKIEVKNAPGYKARLTHGKG